MDNQQKIDVKIDQALNEAIVQNDGGAQLNPDDEDKFRRNYSLAALVFGPVYFAAMNDGFFTALSILFSLTFFPLLFILPFYARNRAWKLHRWSDIGTFIKIQKMWDKFALYFSILSVIVIILAFKFVALPLIQSAMTTLNGAGLNDLKQNYQQLFQ